jgi:hypothetical protein
MSAPEAKGKSEADPKAQGKEAPEAAGGGGLKAWLPLIVTISLVYGATRHELMRPILQNAFRFGIWVTGFMVALFAVLFVIERTL